MDDLCEIYIEPVRGEYGNFRAYCAIHDWTSSQCWDEEDAEEAARYHTFHILRETH